MFSTLAVASSLISLAVADSQPFQLTNNKLSTINPVVQVDEGSFLLNIDSLAEGPVFNISDAGLLQLIQSTSPQFVAKLGTDNSSLVLSAADDNTTAITGFYLQDGYLMNTHGVIGLTPGTKIDTYMLTLGKTTDDLLLIAQDPASNVASADFVPAILGNTTLPSSSVANVSGQVFSHVANDTKSGHKHKNDAAGVKIGSAALVAGALAYLL